MKKQFANVLICLIVKKGAFSLVDLFDCQKRAFSLVAVKPGRGCLQQLRQVGTAAPVQSRRYRPSCRSGKLSFEELGLDIRDKAKLSFSFFKMCHLDEDVLRLEVSVSN